MRRSPPIEASFNCDAPRLACVRPVASVHPEPGSNSSLYYFIFLVFYSIEDFFYHPPSCKGVARDSPVLTLTFFTRLVLLCLSFLQGSICFPRSGGPRSIGKAGAKIKGFYIPLQIFLRLFFHIFSRTIAPRCTTITYRENFFLPSKRTDSATGPPSAQKCMPGSPDISGHGLPYFSFKRKSSAPKSVPPADETRV